MGLRSNHMTPTTEAWFMDHNISVIDQHQFGNGLLMLETTAGKFRFNFKTNDLEKCMKRNEWQSVFNEDTYEQTRLDLGMIL